MRIFKDAASMPHSSVAVPMLGTGSHQYAKEDVVKDIVESVKTFNTQASYQSLTKVFLVVEKNDKDSLLAAQTHFPYNSSALVNPESVKVTLLGFRAEDPTNAASILTRCLNEQTSNERGLSFILLSVSD